MAGEGASRSALEILVVSDPRGPARALLSLPPHPGLRFSVVDPAGVARRRTPPDLIVYSSGLDDSIRERYSDVPALELTAGEIQAITGEARADRLAREDFYEAVWRTVDRDRLPEVLGAAGREWETWLAATGEGIALLDRDRVVISASRRFGEMFGRPVAELIGVPFKELAGVERRASTERPGGPRSGRVVKLPGSDGVTRWLELNQAPLAGDPWKRRLVTVSDITAERQHGQQMERATLYDELTGLATRTLFENRVRKSLQARSTLSEPVAVLLVELDRFRRVNDSFGHPVGDTLLTMVAQRIMDRVREGDTVARYGGDEFAVLLNGVPDEAAARMVAQRVATAFDEAFVIAKQPITITASVGIAVGGTTHTEATDLLRLADVATHVAKEKTGTACVAFNPRRDFAATRKVQLERDLEKAIEGEHLRVYYQPIVDLDTRRVIGGEALVRWEHPVRGTVFPGEFLSMAEETGLISRVDRWVLGKVAEDLAGWAELAELDGSFRIGVNVSEQHVAQDDFAAYIASVLESCGADGPWLRLELPERAIVGGQDQLERIRELGVGLAVDDVGRGHASLENLTSLAIDTLKIDRAFVGGLGTTSRDSAVVEAIVLMARRIGAKAIAEGIEHEEQRDRLLRLGCEFGQGYLFARPEPRRGFERLLAQPRLLETRGS